MPTTLTPLARSITHVSCPRSAEADDGAGLAQPEVGLADPLERDRAHGVVGRAVEAGARRGFTVRFAGTATYSAWFA